MQQWKNGVFYVVYAEKKTVGAMSSVLYARL
jgi:hypothetical protein